MSGRDDTPAFTTACAPAGSYGDIQDTTIEGLRRWVGKQLEQATGDKVEVVLSSLGGDAGFRSYYRVNRHPSSGAPSFLAVNAPPETEDSARFIELAKFLRGHGIPAPAVIAADLGRGFLLIEDFGSVHLADRLEDGAELYYGEALMVMLRMQSLPLAQQDEGSKAQQDEGSKAQQDEGSKAPHGKRSKAPQDSSSSQQQGNSAKTPVPALAAYDQALVGKEYALFTEWFLPWIAIEPCEDEASAIQALGEELAAVFAEQPQVFVHRDFHSRNLMLDAQERLGLIDFQDAVLGPVTYDLISLTKDCYRRWPDACVNRWNLAYAKMACSAGLLPKALLYDDDPELQAKKIERWHGWCDLTALQRHIKVLGIFVRLAERDGKTGYLADLPRVFSYVADTLAHYKDRSPAFAKCHELFERRVLPAFVERVGPI